jgi:hypothetical protein
LYFNLQEIFGEEDNGTFDFEKGGIQEDLIEHPKGSWRGFGASEQTFRSLAALKGWDIGEGDLIDMDGEILSLDEPIGEYPLLHGPAKFTWMENEEIALQKGAGVRDDEMDAFNDQVSVTLCDGFEEFTWTGRADTPVRQTQEENWFAQEVTTAWSQDGESYPNDTPVGVIPGDIISGRIWLGSKPAEQMGETPDWGSNEWDYADQEPNSQTSVHSDVTLPAAETETPESLKYDFLRLS